MPLWSRVQLARPIRTFVRPAKIQSCTPPGSARKRRTIFNVALPVPGLNINKPIGAAGTVRLSCNTHPWMRGWMIVTDDAGAVSGATESSRSIRAPELTSYACGTSANGRRRRLPSLPESDRDQFSAEVTLGVRLKGGRNRGTLWCRLYAGLSDGASEPAVRQYQVPSTNAGEASVRSPSSLIFSSLN